MRPRRPSSWVTRGAPVADPLQEQLEARLRGWDRSGREQATKNGCGDAISAATAAYAADRQLNIAYSSMHDAYAALTTIERCAIAEVVTRSTALSAQIVAFAAALPAVTGALEAEAAVAATAAQQAAIAGAISYATNMFHVVQTLGQHFYENGYDWDDGKIALLGVVQAHAGEYAHTALINGTAGQLLGNFISVAEQFKDMLGTVSDAMAAREGAAKSYMGAANPYNKWLGRLQANITAMNTALKDCNPKEKPAPKPTAFGTPPPDCAAVNRDYAGHTCTTQTRNGTFHFATHVVRIGGTLAGAVANRCSYHSTGDFSQPPDRPCPIDSSAMLSLGSESAAVRDRMQPAACGSRRLPSRRSTPSSGSGSPATRAPASRRTTTRSRSSRGRPCHLRAGVRVLSERSLLSRRRSRAESPRP